MQYDSQVIVKKDGHTWDRSYFDRDNQMSCGAALMDALRWRDKILDEEPEAKVLILVKAPVQPYGDRE